jgi:hypothetical protein
MLPSDNEDSNDEDFLVHEYINNLFSKLALYEPNTEIKIYFSGIRPKCSIE